MTDDLKLKLWIAVYEALKDEPSINDLDVPEDDCTTAERAASVAERAVVEFIEARTVAHATHAEG